MASDTEPTLSTIGELDVVAPGVMLFGVLLLTMTTATGLARETESGALERLRMARAPFGAVLGGIAAAQLTVALVAIGAMLLAAMALGLDNDGSYAALFLILLVGAAACVGPGVAVAALARSRDEAAHLALLLALVLGFLSGAFFHLPAVNLGGVGLYDLLASHHIVAATREILAGGTLHEVAASVWAIVGLGAAYAGLGTVLFRWRRLRPRAAGA
jgi:ABC-type multidrug transport system permease subunit